MAIATETTKVVNPEVPAGVPVTKQEREQAKRGRGRPAKPFVSELPAPPKFDIAKPGDLFDYLRIIPQDKLQRIMLVFYRFHPVCDATEGGSKDKYIEKIPGENHPFADADWEKQILHRYGSGIYGCYLNEMNRTICRCMRIETRWDLENHPPIVDPQWLEQDHPQNRAYVQYLRGRGVKVPTQQEKELETGEMQLADTVSKLTDTLIARTTPVPQFRQESPGEKLTLDAARASIDLVRDQAKQLSENRANESNPLELVEKVVSVADRISGGGKHNNGDDTLKIVLTDAMKRAEDERKAANELQREFIQAIREQNKPASIPPAKSFIEQMREFAEMRTLMKDAFGNGDKSEEGDSAASNTETIVTSIVGAIPTVLQHAVGIWAQFNQTVALKNRYAELEYLAKNGVMPAGAAPPVAPQPQQVQAPQQQPGPQPQQTQTQGANGTELNPSTGQPYTQTELESLAEERRRYAAYHGFIASIAQPLITHLNDPGEVIEGERHRKDGYDFADWFVSGNGRLAYDQLKSLGPDTLFGAIRSYQPLWSQIGGMETRVKEFIGEFLTFDEAQLEEEKEETQQ